MSTKTKEYNYGYEAGRKAGLDEAARRFRDEYSDLGTLAVESAALLLHRTRGYLRVGIGRDGTFYVRHKWLQGTLADLYTLRSDTSLGEAISQVCIAAEQVECGAIKATKDTPYRNKKNHP